MSFYAKMSTGQLTSLITKRFYNVKTKMVIAWNLSLKYENY